MAAKKSKTKVETRTTKKASRQKGASSTRINKIKQVQKEELRKKFKAAEYISQLEQSYKEYEAMLKELDIAKVKKTKAMTERDRKALLVLRTQIDLVKIRLDIIKQKIDLNLRRLKFVLPELRSMELTDPQGDSPFAVFAQAVAAMGEGK